MPFHSFTFIFFFLPAVVAGYFLLNTFTRPFAAKLWLLAASLAFYTSWAPSFTLILLCSALVNFSAAAYLAPQSSSLHHRSRKNLLCAAVGFNLALLCYFKYANFFIANMDAAFGGQLLLLNVALPVGISFFTLQQMAFLADVYEGLAEERSFANYLLFVSFFPYLTAGPITHYREIMPQFEDPIASSIDFRNVSRGLFLFAIGLFKKVILAGMLGGWVSGMHAETSPSLIDAWFGTLAYMLQLYFDFSGYSDMAIALGLFFNINIPVNFNSPLKAATIVEFWRRWHISLANFMRTYVFTAAMRSRPRITFAFSLWMSFVTMLIMGIWHGAGWNYVLFGVLHGLAMVVYALWAKLRLKLPRIVGWFLVFNFINVSLVSIRARDLGETFAILRGLLGGNGFAIPPGFVGPLGRLLHKATIVPLAIGPDAITMTGHIAALGCLIGLVMATRNSLELTKAFKPDIRHLLFAEVLFVVSLLNIHQVSEFIYFHF